MGHKPIHIIKNGSLAKRYSIFFNSCYFQSVKVYKRQHVREASQSTFSRLLFCVSDQ